MDNEGFRQHLTARGLPEEEIAGHLTAMADFARYLGTLDPPQTAEQVDAQAALGYVDRLIGEGNNSLDRLLAMGRYGRFARNDALFVAMVQLIDGAEVLENMHRKVGQVLGEEARDGIFEAPLPPLGTSNWEKAHITRAVMQRLEQRTDDESCRAVFSDCFRDLPDSYFEPDRERYREIGDFDRYLEINRQKFIAELEQLRDERKLYYDQEITDDVVAFVRGEAEISQGVRVGQVLYVTKIPYRTREYLAETDPQRKRYHCCHCPWARESLLQPEGPVPATFCGCSAGYMKKPWEVIFGQPLQVDVLESVLKGDLRCRFAIHLPPGGLGL